MFFDISVDYFENSSNIVENVNPEKRTFTDSEYVPLSRPPQWFERDPVVSYHFYLLLQSNVKRYLKQKI